ncbi:MAG: hypothetical protein H6797_02190 [Candidatus Nomurabacteria bacterium]|nr:MAG: hypothetical protein H6797_02190 [Candidatus Nomurabacteria bacterium]
MEKLTHRSVIRALQESWDIKTSSIPDEWSEANRARGQCVPSSLVVQDYFGGELERVMATGDALSESHYFNRLVDGGVIDSTAMQYSMYAPTKFTRMPVDLAAKNCMTIREYVLKSEQTLARYALLKTRVMDLLEMAEE